jgi:hypothetical protein
MNLLQGNLMFRVMHDACATDLAATLRNVAGRRKTGRTKVISNRTMIGAPGRASAFSVVSHKTLQVEKP